MDEEIVYEVKQLVLKTQASDTGSIYRIKDQTARNKTDNALYSTAQNLSAAQKTQVYDNLGLENCSTLEYVVVS